MPRKRAQRRIAARWFCILIGFFLMVLAVPSFLFFRQHAMIYHPRPYIRVTESSFRRMGSKLTTSCQPEMLGVLHSKQRCIAEAPLDRVLREWLARAGLAGKHPRKLSG